MDLRTARFPAGDDNKYAQPIVHWCYCKHTASGFEAPANSCLRRVLQTTWVR
jgi:hypothetical protein